MFLRTFVIAVVFLAVFAQGATASDDLAGLRYLVGDWRCTYHMAGQAQTFDTSFAFAQSGNWLRETDTWKGGGDQGFITVDATRHQWTEVVVDSGRGTTVLRGPDAGTTKLDLRSVFPDTHLHTVMTRLDSRHFSVAATQAGASGTIASNDMCVKQP